VPGENMIDFWFTAGSTYTYLSVMRIDSVESAAGVKFRWRPFDRRALGRNTPYPVGSSKIDYMWLDLKRRAAMYGIPINIPVPYPPKNTALVNQIALAGLEEGWGKDFVIAAYRRWFQFGEETGGDENVATSLREIGQDAQRVLNLVQGEHIQRLWVSETEQARGLGVFGSPTFAVDAELFWGDDHLEDAVSWHKHGRLVSAQD
jgi:2-hydroxychromene-2-carboxylate isomerase